MKTTVIIGPNAYTEKEKVSNVALVITDGKITKITSEKNLAQEQYPEAEILRFPENWHLIPGKIDLHIHGAHGADVMDATPESLQTISQALLQTGVTSFSSYNDDGRDF